MPAWPSLLDKPRPPSGPKLLDATQPKAVDAIKQSGKKGCKTLQRWRNSDSEKPIG